MSAPKVDVLADFLRYRHIVEQALANYAERCDNFADYPALTSREREMRERSGQTAKLAREAIQALARIGGAA